MKAIVLSETAKDILISIISIFIIFSPFIISYLTNWF